MPRLLPQTLISQCACMFKTPLRAMACSDETRPLLLTDFEVCYIRSGLPFTRLLHTAPSYKPAVGGTRAPKKTSAPAPAHCTAIVHAR